MTQNNNERLDEILEELHNSWLEDDYEYDDPCGVKAKLAIQSLIRTEIAKVLDRLDKETERCQDGCWVSIKAERNKLKEEK